MAGASFCTFLVLVEYSRQGAKTLVKPALTRTHSTGFYVCNFSMLTDRRGCSDGFRVEAASLAPNPSVPDVRQKRGSIARRHCFRHRFRRTARVTRTAAARLAPSCSVSNGRGGMTVRCGDATRPVVGWCERLSFAWAGVQLWFDLFARCVSSFMQLQRGR